jgi:hypothetical protein
MATAMTFQRTTVPSSERDKYFERVEKCRSHYAAANCTYRVFEEHSLPGAFIEFVEAEDETTLTVANANAPYRILDPARIYQEREMAKDAG